MCWPLLTFLIMNYAVVYIIWGFVGDGVYPASWDKWINLGYSLSAIVVLYPIICFRMLANCRLRRLERAKSYLIALPVVLIIAALLICWLFFIRKGALS